MRTEDPLQCYKIGQNVSIQNKEEWKKMELDIMFDECPAKFEQNRNLCDFLLSTGTTIANSLAQGPIFLFSFLFIFCH